MFVLFIVAYTCHKLYTIMFYIAILNLLTVRKTYMMGEKSDELLENAYKDAFATQKLL